MKIAVDFDGTIVEAAYPEIGEEKLFAFKTLLELQKRGHQLILWTSRVGKELDDAVEYCRKKGVEFYAVNKNYPEEILDDTISRKIVTDLYIDDRVVGGFPDGAKYSRYCTRVILSMLVNCPIVPGKNLLCFPVLRKSLETHLYESYSLQFSIPSFYFSFRFL